MCIFIESLSSQSILHFPLLFQLWVFWIMLVPALHIWAEVLLIILSIMAQAWSNPVKIHFQVCHRCSTSFSSGLWLHPPNSWICFDRIKIQKYVIDPKAKLNVVVTCINSNSSLQLSDEWWVSKPVLFRLLLNQLVALNYTINGMHLYLLI